ncbi:MAG TPA: cysteine hydrolase family protein [Solirubrobacteraceae bacterium]|jgi:nicotinamidase-related amidase|nr:cysteine hydrolase family protein [Solirubrobacteraceae bacterium]
MADPTLIVIDVQRAFDDPSWGPRNNPAAEARVADALAAWRDAGAPIVHVRHSSAGLFDPDADTFAFKPEAAPLDGEPVVTKHVNSAFIGTDLEAQLRRSGASSVALVGLTTDHCCSSTARMAGNLGFETWVLGDAMATFDRREPDGSTLPADLMHRAALASLHDEFAEVLATADAVARLRR